MAFEIRVDENDDKFLIDTETNVIFKENETRGRGRGAPEMFDLIVDDKVIQVNAYFEFKNIPDEPPIVIWHIDQIFIPKTCPVTREDATNLSVAALKVYRFHFDPQFRVDAVHLNSSKYNNYLL